MERASWSSVKRQLGFSLLAVATMAGGANALASSHNSSMPAAITHQAFGVSLDGTPVALYTLRNQRGMQVTITNYGGIVVSLTAPDRRGHYEDIVLGYETLAPYLMRTPYFGALVGRYANRIAYGQFILGGTRYRLATNDPPNALHGGTVGFDKVVWNVARAAVVTDGPQLTLSYISRDGEEGYPGTLSVTAVYTLSEDNALRLDYTATTDRETVVNLSQHSYFNLQGLVHRGDIVGHIVSIDADYFTPVDSTLIPTGELWAVADTPFDFRRPTMIGKRIAQANEQLRFGKGYDHNWVLNGWNRALRLNATVYEPSSGRMLEVLSDQPGLQFYTGNQLDGTLTGKGGWIYGSHSGFCMEPQHFPDSPNHAAFPSTVLKPGDSYHSTIVYRFSTR